MPVAHIPPAEAPAPACPAAEAGDLVPAPAGGALRPGRGVVAGAGGETRCCHDGVLEVRDGVAAVRSETRITRNLTHAGAREIVVRGSLTVEGGIGAGVAVHVTGDLVVEGVIERAEVMVGGALLVEGRISHSEVACGLVSALEGRLRRTLRTTAADLEACAAQARVLRAAAETRLMWLPEGRALAMVAGARSRELAPALTGGADLLARAQEDLPSVAPALAAELALLAAVIGGRTDGPADAITRAEALAGRLRARWAGASQRRGRALVAPEIVGSRVRATGHVRLTGRGLDDTECTSGGDVVALGPSGRVAGGDTTVAGRLLCRTLGGETGTVTLVRLGGSRVQGPFAADHDRLQAASVGGGVEVRAFSGSLRLEKDPHGVGVYVASGIPLIRP